MFEEYGGRSRKSKTEKVLRLLGWSVGILAIALFFVVQIDFGLDVCPGKISRRGLSYGQVAVIFGRGFCKKLFMKLGWSVGMLLSETLNAKPHGNV